MSPPVLHSKLWEEEAEADNPFAARACHCSGYDVFGDILQQASYLEYLYLLFRRERPTPAQARALEILAIALANPGPREPSVHAAMAAGIGGAPAAAALMSALAVGAGASGGARDVRLAMERWQRCGRSLNTWQADLITPPRPTRQEVWLDCGHPPGFAPYEQHSALPTRQTLSALADAAPGGACAWLAENSARLEGITGRALAMTGVAAAALIDLGFLPEEGEMLALLLRLPGAAAHALEQADLGFRHFPFPAIAIENDPGPASAQGVAP